MTDIYGLTEQLENAALLASNGYPISTGSATTQQPFYVDSNGHFNFGYGMDITLNGTASLSAGGTGGLSSADLAKVNQYLADSITLSQLNSSITQQDWRPTASNVLQYFYNNIVVPDVKSVVTATIYSSLNISAQQALQFMYYNFGGTFWGGGISSALNVLDYGTAAWELAFNNNNPNTDQHYTADENRTLIAAALMLGFNVMINGSNAVTSLSSTANTSPTSVVAFLFQMYYNRVSDVPYINSSVLSFLGSLNSYTKTIGYYIPIGVSETATTVSGQNLNGISITPQVLANLNAVFSDSSFAQAGLVHIPVSQTTLTSTATSLPTLTGNETYIFDTNSIYVVGAGIDGSKVNTLINDLSGHATITLPSSDTFKAIKLPSGDFEIDGTSGGVQNFKETIYASVQTNSGTLALGTNGIRTIVSASGINNNGNISVAANASLEIDAPLTSSQPSYKTTFDYQNMAKINSAVLAPGATSTVSASNFSSSALNFVGSSKAPTNWSMSAKAVAASGNTHFTSFSTTFQSMYQAAGVQLASMQNTALKQKGINDVGMTITGTEGSGATNSNVVETVTLNLGSGLGAGDVFSLYSTGSTSLTITASYQGHAVSTAGWNFDPEWWAQASGNIGNETINASTGTVTNLSSDILLVTPNVPVDQITITNNATATSALTVAAPIGAFDSYLTVGDGATLALDSPAQNEQTVVFSTGNGTLVAPSTSNLYISNFQLGDVIKSNSTQPIMAGWEDYSKMHLEALPDADGVDTDWTYGGYTYQLVSLNQTLTASSYDDLIVNFGAGDNVNAGAGNDEIDVAQTVTSGVINGGTGTNALGVSGSSTDISGITVSNIQTLILNNAYVKLSAAQLAPITSIQTYQNTGGVEMAIYAASAGTYNLSNISFQTYYPNGINTWLYNTIDLYGSSGNDILTGTAINGTRNEIIHGGAGDDTIYSTTSSRQNLYGDDGNDTFIISRRTGDSGENLGNIDGGTGTNVIQINGGGPVNFGGTIANIAGVYLENAPQGQTQSNYVVYTNSLSQHLAFYGSSGNDTFYLQDTSQTQTFNLGNGNNILYGYSDRVGAIIKGGTGQNNLYILGPGSSSTATLNSADTNLHSVTIQYGSVSLVANSESGLIINDTSAAGTSNSITLGGNNQVINETAQNDTIIDSGAYAGAVINGGTGNNVLASRNADLSVLSLNHVQTLDASQNWVKLTNAEFTGFTTYTAEAANIDIFAMNAGTYNLGSKTVNGSGSFSLDASQSTGNVTLIGTNSAGQALMGGSGTDTLTAGNGANDTMTAGSGATTMNAGTGNDVFNAAGHGNDTMNGGQGTETYRFVSSFGQDTINNIATGTRTTAAGAIDFGFANSYHDLWFKQSGSNLVIDLLGTTDTITVNNWYGTNAGAEVSSIVDTTDNYTMMNTKVAALVSAMASYTSSHTSFNPQATGTTMPTDTTLQNALTAAWGHS